MGYLNQRVPAMREAAAGSGSYPPQAANSYPSYCHCWSREGTLSTSFAQNHGKFGRSVRSTTPFCFWGVIYLEHAVMHSTLSSKTDQVLGNLAHRSTVDHCLKPSKKFQAFCRASQTNLKTATYIAKLEGNKRLFDIVNILRTMH